MIDDVLAYVGQFGITIVAAVGAAYALFRFVGQKWIEGKFDKQLEDHRHAHQRELEKLRLEIEPPR